jgi:hypothetical protein
MGGEDSYLAAFVVVRTKCHMSTSINEFNYLYVMN